MYLAKGPLVFINSLVAKTNVQGDLLYSVVAYLVTGEILPRNRRDACRAGDNDVRFPKTIALSILRRPSPPFT